MAFIFRLVLGFGKMALVVIVLAILIYATVWLLNRVTQWLANQLGYEVGDFFQWAKKKLPRIKIERKEDEKNP